MKYLFTVKFAFEALDDIEARRILNSIKVYDPVENTKVEQKLQRLREDGPPEKVNL